MLNAFVELLCNMKWFRMGSGCSTPEMIEASKKSKQIDRNLEKEKELEMSNQKLLLLGTGECGKSTILKQIQILHANGFSTVDLEERKGPVYSNIVIGMAQLVDGLTQFGYSIDPLTERYIKMILATVEGAKDHLPITAGLYEALKFLWASVVVQKVYERRNELQITDSLAYFMDSLDRIYDTKFMPTQTDVLHTRIPTTGVVQLKFPIKGSIFKVVDVGGQRSERKKWLHQFDDVSAIIFISAISEYDQVLLEDRTVNRMKESMELFKNISRSAFFTKAAMILFLNKRDLFIEKIKKKPITCFFTKYAGKSNYDECIVYIKKVFTSLSDAKNGKMLYTHETCATDTDQVQIVIDSVIDSIINKNLKGTGIEM